MNQLSLAGRTTHGLRLEMAGLTIDSSLHLPELASGPRRQGTSATAAGPGAVLDDRVLRVRHHLCADVPGVAEDPPRFVPAEGGWEMVVGGIARVHVDLYGSLVRVTYRAGADPLLLAHLVVDQAVPLVLVARGRTVLHATSVAEHGRAIAFLGPTGTGKSTLALGFAAEGALLVADDCLVVVFRGSCAEVVPSYPSGRLRPDSVDALGLGMSTAAAAGGKHRVTLACAKGVLAPAVPLDRLFVLERDDTLPGPIIHRLSPVVAAWSVARNAFRSPTPNDSDPVRSIGALAAVRPIIDRVPVFSLRYPSDLAALADVRDAVRQAASVPGGSASGRR